jgi:hypothetical protein
MNVNGKKIPIENYFRNVGKRIKKNSGGSKLKYDILDIFKESL